MRTFTTPETLAAGINGSGICPLLYPLSYGGSRRRQESNRQPSDPDVTRAFTTPQTFESLLPSPMLAPFTRTPIVRICKCRLASPIHSREEFRGGIGAHGDSGFEPEPCGFPLK